MLRRIWKFAVLILLVTTGTTLPLCWLALTTRGESPLRIPAYALVVGCGPEGDSGTLRFTVQDARSLATVLEGAGYHVELLVNAPDLPPENSRPDAESIRRALRRLATLRAERVLVFFSGLGAGHDQVGYYVPEAGDSRRPRTLISEAEILEALRRCEAPTRLALFDFQTSSSASVEDSEGLAIFRSTCPGGLSLELPELKHSLFAYALLQGLSGLADLDHDHRITLPELEIHTKRSVSQLAGEKLRSQQMPDLRGHLYGLPAIAERTAAVTPVRSAPRESQP